MDLISRLEVDSLTHSFGHHRVLAGIFLKCEPGEIVGVLGPNGCGKTTMLRALFGVLHANSMHLSLGGETVDHAYRTERLGFLAQEPFLPRRMTVGGAARGLFGESEACRTLLGHPRIAPLQRRRVGSLSGGEQRYLEVMLIVSLPAPFVFLDEPFTEIEPIHRESLKEMIRHAAQVDRKGILITDHAYRDVLDTADRIEVFAGGVLRPAAGESDLKRWGYTP
ncbi:MAG: ATP-binding cassette domain-containing protein [Spirochaetia bacterium]